MNEFNFNRSNIATNKEESIKMLGDFEKRKLDYQMQMERFKLRKEELLCQS